MEKTQYFNTLLLLSWLFILADSDSTLNQIGLYDMMITLRFRLALTSIEPRSWESESESTSVTKGNLGLLHLILGADPNL